MAQAKMTLEEIRRSDPFISEDSHIDLSAYPWLTPLADAPVEDEEFGGLVNESRVNLRKALTDMVEKEGRDPEVAHVLAEAGLENPSLPATVYIADKPFTIVFEQGLWRGEGVLNRMRHRLTAKSRDELINKLMALARKVKRETVEEELTEAQLLEVGRIAGTGDRVGAIYRYLKYAIPESFAEKYDDPNEGVNDPSLRRLTDLVCEFVWLHSRLDASDSDEWQDFKAQYVGNRPISCQLLDNAWTEFSSSRNRLVFAPAPGTKEPEPLPAAADIENMTDAEIDATYKGVARSFAQGGRR